MQCEDEVVCQRQVLLRPLYLVLGTSVGWQQSDSTQFQEILKQIIWSRVVFLLKSKPDPELPKK